VELHTKFGLLQEGLNDRYAERTTEIDLGIKGLVARQHVLQIGPPGTAKSMLAHDLATAFDVPYMRKLLGKSTPPEEMFGPYDLAAIKESKFRRVTTDRTAQRAVIQFWDEIFKSSAAIRNTMLTILNERYYDHGDEFYTVPLITVFAASNELPDDSEESGAFFDRFLLRRFVSYIKDPSQFVKMMRATRNRADGTTIDLGPVMTHADLLEAHAEAMQVVVPTSLEEALLDLRTTLDLEGIIASDRRWGESQDIIRVNAWQDGRGKADESDIIPLQHVLWEDPSHIKPVLRTILAMASPVSHRVVDLTDQVEQIEAQLREEVKRVNVDGTEKARSELREQGIEWFTKLEGVMKELAGLQEKTKDDNRAGAVIEEAMNKTEQVTLLVGSDAMKLTSYNNALSKMRERVFGE
jgi:MoxR-like ATPase